MERVGRRACCCAVHLQDSNTELHVYILFTRTLLPCSMVHILMVNAELNISTAAVLRACPTWASFARHPKNWLARGNVHDAWRGVVAYAVTRK